MRFREKMILIIMGLLILAVFLEALPTIYPEFDGRINNEIEPNANDQTKVVGQPQFPISLSANGWGKDIFHDRSNIYNSWFKLTGITEFENGYKAIVNGEIVHKMNRVRGFTVTSITETEVVLQRNEYRVTLKMEK
ncbi:hypothetical protein Ct9H90mP29_06530 [bacterium]|jgi:hypothetical protein|nr:MAG: hypothetical protein Ct9H90mP29_06530 [bacterium]|tara:strand:+ start:631 stop:1038 length:408 start_codon:yes stop_codon:yes gene_type:complete